MIGYISYDIDYYTSRARNFGIVSFCKGNPLIGKEVFNQMEYLLHDLKLHSLEWRMVAGNPAERSYDVYCRKYNGNKHILMDAIKDKYVKYHNDVIYEIINYN